MVDVGCGPGNITDTYDQYFNFDKMTAFDISPEMITFARNNYQTVDNRINFKVADAGMDWSSITTLINVPVNRADLVISVYCLHWVSDERKSHSLFNIKQMLKPNGKAFIRVYAHSELLWLLEQAIMASKWSKYANKLLHSTDLPEHSSGMGRLAFWKSCCDEVGLKVVKAELEDAEFDFDDETSFYSKLIVITC